MSIKIFKMSKKSFVPVSNKLDLSLTYINTEFFHELIFIPLRVSECCTTNTT